MLTNAGTLAVLPVPLNVTAADAARPYGATNPAFSGTLTGLHLAFHHWGGDPPLIGWLILNHPRPDQLEGYESDRFGVRRPCE